MRHIVEHFEGYVTEVKEDTFWARCEDVDGDEWEMEIITDKVLTDEEREYLQLGAIFDWVLFSDETQWFIFYKEVWTQEEIDAAKEAAKEFIEFFNNNNKEETNNGDRKRESSVS